MNGKQLQSIYSNQVLFQECLMNDGLKLPRDNAEEYQRSVTLIVEELGELLKTDKRWKSIRKDTYDREEKLNEYADVFICVLNLAIHSGFKLDEITDSVCKKIGINFERLAKEKTYV